MRQPLEQKGSQSQVSASRSYPAPIGGWNARDALAEMPPTDAIVLENWFPNTSYVEMRGGYTPDASSATGMTGNGKTLAVYNGLSGINKLFCYTNSGVYDVSAVGPVGASLAVRTNGKHQWVMFGDGTNNWLIACNGVDSPLYFDGTNWIAVTGVSSPALTGVTTSTLIYPWIFKGRLMFLQTSTLGFWYLASGAAGGALTYFDLSGVARKGGYVMAASTWTVDTGFGPDDRCAFITSEGEVIVYAGTNPSVAANWALIGTYILSKPLGRRCMLKYGTDVLILTQNGVFPLSGVIIGGRVGGDQEPSGFKLSVSYKIEQAFSAASSVYGSNFGWEAIIYPNHTALIVNVPIAEDGEHQQFVMNTITRSWCKFTGWTPESFAVFNGDLYFTTGTKVVKAWTGTIDGVNNITAYAKTAFSYMDSPSVQKKFKLFRPVLSTNGTINFLTDVDIDYQDNPITATATYSPVTRAQWDVNNWDQSYWAAGLEVVRKWTAPADWTGYTAAGKIKISTNNLNVQWAVCDWIYERGGIF